MKYLTNWEFYVPKRYSKLVELIVYTKNIFFSLICMKYFILLLDSIQFWFYHYFPLEVLIHLNLIAPFPNVFVPLKNSKSMFMKRFHAENGKKDKVLRNIVENCRYCNFVSCWTRINHAACSMPHVFVIGFLLEIFFFFIWTEMNHSCLLNDLLAYLNRCFDICGEELVLNFN